MSRPIPPPQRASSQLKWVFIDHDNTMANSLWTPDNPTSEIGDPIMENIVKAWDLAAAGYKLWVHTSRPGWDHEAIEQWYAYYDIPLRGILTGKPLGAAYIDDRAVHADEDNWLAAVRRISGRR